jgi:hypothetical protein
VARATGTVLGEALGRALGTRGGDTRDVLGPYRIDTGTGAWGFTGRCGLGSDLGQHSKMIGVPDGNLRGIGEAFASPHGARRGNWRSARTAPSTLGSS